MLPISLIYEAITRIDKHVKMTDCIYMDKLSKETGVKVYLKLENLQYSNSFKKRGAANKIFSLNEDERAKGVICASAGNHAQGVASSATALGIKATIVMPETAPAAKVQATKNYGGNVVLKGRFFDEAYNHAKELEAQTGATFIHPFDDEYIMAGQGTIGIEIARQLNGEFDAVVCGIGGGGLLAGVGSAIKALKPEATVIGVQAANAPAMKQSFDSKEWTEVPTTATLADGMNVARPGRKTFEIIKEVADEIHTVSEDNIGKAIKKLALSCKIVSEGAGATGIAALLEGKLDHLKGKRVVFVISGGNIDEEKLISVLSK